MRDWIHAGWTDRRAATLVLVLCAITIACGDDSDGSSSPASATHGAGATGGVGGFGGGAGGAGGAAPGGSGGAEPCNALSNGPPVDVIQVAEALPIGRGGVIADGTYVLTAVAFYTGPGGPTGPTVATVQGMLSIQSSALEYVYRISGEDEVRVRGALMTQGSEFLLTHSCPDMEVETYPYTASATTLFVIFPENSWTFTKQP